MGELASNFPSGDHLIKVPVDEIIPSTGKFGSDPSKLVISTPTSCLVTTLPVPAKRARRAVSISNSILGYSPISRHRFLL